MKDQYTGTHVGSSSTNLTGVPLAGVTPTTTSTVPLAKRVSWGAIFAGVAISLAIQVGLSLLGVAIGASAVDPLRDQHPGKGIGMGAGIWWVVSSLISMFIGAWVAGRLSGAVRNTDGRLHGLLTWSVSTLLTVYLLTTAVGSMIGGAASLLGKAAPAAAQAANSGDLQSQLRQLGIDPNALKSQAQNQVPPGTLSPTGRTAYDAQQADAQKAQAEQKAREAGDAAARGVAQGAFWSFILLALSALAASFGGDRGTRRFERYEPVGAAA